MADDPAEESVITPREVENAFVRTAGKVHRFVLRRFHGLVLDVEDVHFHFDSAVMLPDYGDCKQTSDAQDENHITGLAVLRAVYRHAKEHAEKKILITGHTDKEGPTKYNVELSRLRAENVLHLLLGNRAEWVKISHKKSQVKDYQQILKWVHATWRWDCDPGKLDNDLGDKTREAVRAFQWMYNTDTTNIPADVRAKMRGDGKSEIAVDGKVGEETWGAFFDVYIQALKRLLEVDDAALAALRQSLQFIDPKMKTIGCGETHANVPDLIGSAPTAAREKHRALARIDRRVQVLFFDPGEEPQLDCHLADGSCVKEKCEIYFKHFFRFELLRCDPAAVSTERIWPLRLLIRGPRTPAQTEPVHIALAGRRYAVVPVGADGGPVPEFVTPVLRGTTDGEGIVRIPVQEGQAKMILKVDVGGLLMSTTPPPAAPAAAPAPASPPAGSPWDGEETFMQFSLDCGSLKPLSGAGDEPALQRLHNLGYGRADLTDQRAALFSVKAFQQDYKLKVSGAIDNDTRKKVGELYGS
jgi:hypothetical protein